MVCFVEGGGGRISWGWNFLCFCSHHVLNLFSYVSNYVPQVFNVFEAIPNNNSFYHICRWTKWKALHLHITLFWGPWWWATWNGSLKKKNLIWEATHLMYKIREEKKRGTWTLPYGQTLKLIYLICTISYFHRWPSIARSAKSMILHPRESYIYIKANCLFVCRGPETHITFKTVPPNSRAQKLFRTSIAHFYFFTYQVPNPEGPKTIHNLNHTLLLLYLPSPESRVLSPDQSRSQVPTPKLQITYWGAYGQRAKR